MKNFIVTSPFFPENFQNFSHRLRANGINVLGLGEEPYDQLGDKLRSSLTDYFRVNNMEDKEEVLRACAFLFYKHGRIDYVESQNEYWLELDACIRQQFDISGCKPSDLLKVKHKSKMKEYFKKAGVPVVEGFAINSKDDLENALTQIDFPLVAKPDNGVGASATFKLENREDVDSFLDSWDRSITYFVEPYIEDGTLITFDGIVDFDGDIIFETSFVYADPTLEALHDHLDVSYTITPDIDPLLAKYGRDVVKTFGMRGRFFHIEFFRLADNSYVALEYNNRPAGGYTVDVYDYAFDIDLYDIYARMIKGEKISPVGDAKHYSVAITQRSIYTYENNANDIRSKFNDKLKFSEPIPAAFAQLLGDYMYIITTDSKREVEEIISFVHKHK